MILERLRDANLRLYPRRILLPPEWLVLGVNTVCNLHCRMCDVGLARTDSVFARNLTGPDPRDMTIEMASRVFDQAARYYPSIRIGFAFTEPLIWPHLVDAVSAASDRGLATAVTTNGLTLPSVGVALAEAGLGELFVSLDGPADVHDRIRGREGSFRRAVTGLERLVDLPRRPRLSVYCTVTPWGQGHLQRFVDSVAHLPLEQIGFMHPNFTTGAMAAEHNRHYGVIYPATTSNLGPMDPEDMDLAALEAEVAALRCLDPGFPIAFSPDLDGRSAFERFYRAPHEPIGRGCSDVHRTLMIRADGSVIPAHGRCYEVPVGHLDQQTLPEVWNSAEMARLRVTLRRAGGLMPACARCCSAF